MSSLLSATRLSRNRRDGSNTRMPVLMRLWRRRWLYVLLLPGLLYFIIFIYIPYFGSVIAFQDFSPFRGIDGSPFVGLKHFERLFTDPAVGRVIVNTLILSGLQILIAFPVPIMLALMLNEVASPLYKRVVQSIVYLPHFISWVIIVGIWNQIFGAQGLANQVRVEAFGLDPVSFLTNIDFFRPSFIIQNIWKESGWGTIIFLAALSGINVQLYEASAIDGANRWQQIRHVTLPGIMSVVLIVLIIRLGHVLTVGFEHIFLLLNSASESQAQVIDTFVYTRGILNGNFSFAAAAGLVQGIVGLGLVLLSNWLAKRFGEGGIF